MSQQDSFEQRIDEYNDSVDERIRFKTQEQSISLDDESGCFQDLSELLRQLFLILFNQKQIILPNDPRLTNNEGTWTLSWNTALIDIFGTDEATFKVLFINDDGSYKEQKGIPANYNYTDGNVSSVSFEIVIDIPFKIIITR
jgi:hypothetical protein